MTDLKFLGRGSAFNTREGNTSAYIKDNNTLFLIDCGSNIFQRVIDKDILEGVNDVYVVITHRHADHIGSLPDLILYCYYVKKIKVNIFHSDNNIINYLLSSGVITEQYNIFENSIEPLNIEIKKYHASHCGIYKNKFGEISEDNSSDEEQTDLFPCYSFVFDNGVDKIFYSGDCNSVSWSSEDINSCNKFYVDCCFADYDGNVHYNINKLYNDCIENNINISDVYCMHFDCYKAINEAEKLGFNIVRI